MSLDVRLTAPQSRLTTIDGLVVEVELTNRTGTALTIPSPNDTSGALAFELLDAGGHVIRRCDGLTHQSMMSSARVDWREEREVLPAGASWQWTLDLASYHYGLPEGSFGLEAVYRPAEDAPEVRSARVAVDVASAPLVGLTWTRDNPVLDGVTGIFRGAGDASGRDRLWLRQHNAGRPLASWYSCELALDLDADAPFETLPFVGAPTYFQTEAFDPAFQKWIVWSQRGEVRAQRFDFGRNVGSTVRRMAVPPNARLLRSACVTENDELLVFFLDPSVGLVAHVLDDGGNREKFRHPLPGVDAGAPDPVVRGDCEGFLHVAWASRGVVYDRVTYDGQPKRRVHAHKTGVPMYSLEFDPVTRKVLALFADAPHGHTVELVVVGPTPEETRSQRFDRLALRGDVCELAFDHDQQGRFHLLVSTTQGRLYYYSNGRGPYRIADDTPPFFPRIIAPARAYLGWLDRSKGYRFFEFDRLRRGPKLIAPNGERP